MSMPAALQPALVIIDEYASGVHSPEAAPSP